MSGYGLVSRAYPRQYWDDNGEEILAVANEVSATAWSLRQALSLLGGGLRTRARLATRSTMRGVWESGARIALLLTLGLHIAGGLNSVVRSDWFFEPVQAGMLGSSVGAFVVLLRRFGLLAAVLVSVQSVFVAWNATQQFFWPPSQIGGRISLVAYLVGPALTYVALAWWLVLRGGAVKSVAVLGPLAGVAAATALIGTPDWFLVGIPLALLAVGLVLALCDPRLLAAMVLVGLIWLVSALPLALTKEDTGIGHWLPLALMLGLLTIFTLIVRWSARRMIAT
ncbi:MAG: hypothetical protein GY926_17895 [bacterium]|nr:hypothetical protein [bacterium]